MPRTKVNVPNVAEADPGLWSNCIRAGDLLFIAGQVARPFEGGRTLVGSNEYEQTKQIFSRIKRICEAAGGSLEDIVKMIHLRGQHQEQHRGLACTARVLHR